MITLSDLAGWADAIIYNSVKFEAPSILSKAHYQEYQVPVWPHEDCYYYRSPGG